MLVAGGDHTDGPGESMPLIGEGHIRLGDERDWGGASPPQARMLKIVAK